MLSNNYKEYMKKKTQKMGIIIMRYLHIFNNHNRGTHSKVKEFKYDKLYKNIMQEVHALF